MAADRQTRRTRPRAAIVGQRRASAAIANLGEQVALARKRRKQSQAELAAKVGIDQTRLSQIERGKGDGVPAHTWFALGEALGIYFRIEFGRDRLIELEDAGHLEMQDFLLALARANNRGQAFELPTKPSNPALSVDVCARDDRLRILIIQECWNTFGNIGGSIRTTRRKIAEAEQFAVAIARGGPPYRVAACWIVRDTARNREVIDGYPAVFKSTFVGASAQWVDALVNGADPPRELGLIWFDSRGHRLRAWR